MTTETGYTSYIKTSAVVQAARDATNQLRSWFAASWLARTTRAITQTTNDAVETATVADAIRAVASWTRHSYLYRWLTKEPDPDVVVIDLRETYTVGPVIALLDRLAPALERAWRGLRAYRLSEELRTSSKRRWITDSRVVQLLAAALEPPEPPDEDRRD